MNFVRWIASAALAAYACHLAVTHAAPIDAALPLLGIAVTLFAALSYPSVMLGVPLLIVAERTIPDEGMRLLVFGVVIAASGALSLRSSESGDVGRRTPYLAVAFIVLLRWIPLSEVLIVRELLLLAIAVAIVLVLGRTPFAVAVALITALITPAVPMRTLALPLLVLGVAVLGRVFGMPRLTLTWPSAVAVGSMMLFFAWSGIVARAFPYFLRDVLPQGEKYTVGYALAANDSVDIEVPGNARALLVSGANVAGFRRGKVLGRIEPGGMLVRVGDAADWGYLRRDAFYGSRNPLPRDPAGKIRGYGYTAWLDGAGRVPLPRGARVIRVTGDAALPPGASLQVEGFELAPR